MMKQRIKAWLLFLVSLGILGLGATSAYRAADMLLLSASGILIVAMIVMKLRNLWLHRRNPKLWDAHLSSGQSGILPERWSRWMLGEDTLDQKSN